MSGRQVKSAPRSDERRRGASVTKQDDQFEITASPKNAGVARERIRKTAEGLGFAREALDDMEVAVGEAVTNAILYGSPDGGSPIVVRTSYLAPDKLFQIEVHDRGQGFDPSHMRTAENDTDALGGRGLRLMRALMDDVWLHYNGEGMVVRMTKSMHSE